MEIRLQPLLAAAAIVKEATGIFRRNGRFMISIASFGIFLYTDIVGTKFLSLRPSITYLTEILGFLLVTSPVRAEYANLLTGFQKEILFFFVWEYIFAATYFIVTIIFSIAMVYASAILHRGKDPISSDIWDLAKPASWKRPFLISLYTSIFRIGYIFLLLFILLPLALHGPTFVTTLLCVVAGLLYNYLGVVWAVGLVVSAVENRRRIKALGEAARLVKGMRIQGCALSLGVSAILVITGNLWRFVSFKQPRWNEQMVFTSVYLILLVRMFALTCYTVYYYECKSFHGEEVSDDKLMIVGDDTKGCTTLNFSIGAVPEVCW